MAPSRFSIQPHDLAAMLSGKILPIPNLKLQFPSWPSGQNKHVDQIRQWLDQMLEEIQDKKKLQGIKSCDFGLLACCCFPDSDWEQLKVGAAFLVWIFIWDDAIDHGEDESEVASSNELARVYCTQSLDHAKWALGLDDSDREEPPHCPIPSMRVFDQFVKPLTVEWNHVQRQRFFAEIKYYMDHVQIEQMHEQNEFIPSPENYTELRLGTSGITPAIVLCEFTRGVRLPDWLMDCEAMRALWTEITRVCMMTNDIYSLQKELRSGAVHSMIPVMVNANGSGDLDAVMQEFMGIFSKAIEDFEELFQRLKDETGADSGLKRDLELYVSNCQTLATGLLAWMLGSKRYRVGEFVQADGSALVPLA